MRIVDQAHLPIAAASHPGMSGKKNEDRYGVTAFRLEDGTPAVLAVLADGIGGHLAGEVAAEIAVERISRVVAQSDGSTPVDTLAEAVRQASREIRRQAKATGRSGMGATCVCAWIIGRRLYIASVGDSRIYLIRDGRTRQLTKDHTWVQEAVDQGVLRPDQARVHPMSHVIRRHLGSENAVVPDMRLHLVPQEEETRALANQGLLLQPGDRVVLCSDGLTDLVEDGEILAAFGKHGLRDAITSLIELANQRGGHDNITLVAIGVPASRAWRRLIHSWLWALGCALLALFALCGVIGGWWLWWSLVGGK